MGTLKPMGKSLKLHSLKKKNSNEQTAFGGATERERGD